jgi:hypothetical protein
VINSAANATRHDRMIQITVNALTGKETTMQNYAPNCIDADVAKQLTEKWSTLLDYSDDRTAPITESHKRLSTAMLLENEMRYLKEQSTASTGGVFGTHQGTFNGGFSADTYATGDARLPKVLIPMIRRTYPELITNEIVGVQPMSGPVGLAFALRYKYQATPLNSIGVDPVQRDGYASAAAQPWWTAANGKEAGYNYLNTAYTGVTSDVFATAMASGVASLSGTGASGQASAISALINAQDMGIAAIMSQFEMTGRIPQMTIALEKTAVEAGTRRLAASWSTELEQDLKAMNGIDVDNEMTNAMSYELQAEIDREMLTRMLKICLETGFADPGKGKGFSFWNAGTADGRWLGERCRDFYARIIVEANRIAVNNRRGPANFIIATPRVCALLEILEGFKAMPVNGNVGTQSTGVSKVGTVGGRFNIYRDTRTEAQYDMNSRDNVVEYALLGYKGADYWDTGIVFCPYIPVMVQRTVAPNDMSPRVGLMTRYGVVDHIFGSNMFYHLIVVTGLGSAVATQYATDGKIIIL